jgi:hypothetical protein
MEEEEDLMINDDVVIPILDGGNGITSFKNARS